MEGATGKGRITAVKAKCTIEFVKIVVQSLYDVAEKYRKQAAVLTLSLMGGRVSRRSRAM